MQAEVNVQRGKQSEYNTHTYTHSRRIYLGADKSIVSWKLGHFIDFVSGPRLHSPRVFPFSSASSSNNNNKKAEEDISLGFFLDVKNACHGTPLFPMKRRRGGNWHHNMDQSFRSMNPAAGARWIRKKK